MTTTLLIDADILAYTAATKGQRTYDFGGEKLVAVGDLDDVIPVVDEQVQEWLADLDADRALLCLSCPSEDGWRRALYAPYKAHRPITKPALLGPIKDYMRANFEVRERPALEADDVMGILSTHPTLIKGRKIIVSIDKDMRTIPGWLYNPDKDKEPQQISREVANYWHLYQTLVGDSADNYPGCPGIGPVKADAALEGQYTLAQMWERVVGLFESKGLTEKDALLQARLARICRHTDYDFKRKEVKLWLPPPA